jgi:hypothetical protein
VQQLCDVTIEELFSARSVPRCYKEGKSTVYLLLRQSPASKAVNTKTEGSTALEAVTDNDRRKTDSVRAVLNYRVRLSDISILTCSYDL